MEINLERKPIFLPSCCLFLTYTRFKYFSQLSIKNPTITIKLIMRSMNAARVTVVVKAHCVTFFRYVVYGTSDRRIDFRSQFYEI